MTETFSISEAREKLALVVDQVRNEHLPVYLTRHGHRVAAIIAADDLDRLMEHAEDTTDIRAAREAEAEMQETGALPEPAPWRPVGFVPGTVPEAFFEPLPDDELALWE